MEVETVTAEIQAKRPGAPKELQVASGQLTLQGRSTQDRVFSLAATVPRGHAHIPFGLLMVADGVSGTARGIAAADIAIEVISRDIVKRILVPALTRRGTGCRQASIHEALRGAVQEANKRIMAVSAQSHKSASTTLTALLIMGNAGHLIHVGDSRAYIIGSGGSLRQVSTDHSLSARLDSIGQPGNGEEDRNVLYRALGAKEYVQPQMTSFQLDGVHGFLLCTDGFWSAAGERDIERVIAAQPGVRPLCDSLLQLSSGHLNDDASVIVGLFGENTPDRPVEEKGIG